MTRSRGALELGGAHVPTWTTVQLGVVAIVTAACSSGGGGPPPAAPAKARSPARTLASPGCRRPARRRSRRPQQARRVVRPEVRAQIEELEPDGTYQAATSTSPTRSRSACARDRYRPPTRRRSPPVAGGGRWDVSVGSMTITVDRLKALDFRPPYYYTPAQIAASAPVRHRHARRPRRQEDLLRRGRDLRPVAERHAGLRPRRGPGEPPTASRPPRCRPIPTAPTSGRPSGRLRRLADLQTVVDGAIAAGCPWSRSRSRSIYEPLAVAADENGPSTADFSPILKKIVDDMHADGYLSARLPEVVRRRLHQGEVLAPSPGQIIASRGRPTGRPRRVRGGLSDGHAERHA